MQRIGFSLKKKGDKIVEALVRTSTHSIHKSMESENDIVATYRFLKNPRISESLLIQQLSDKCAEQVADQEVLALCDTSTFNFSKHKNRITDFTGLGPLGFGRHPNLGFFLHPILVVGEKTGMPLGISDVNIWSRRSAPIRERSKRYELRSVPIEQKESYKWLGPCLKSKSGALKNAKHITFVMDREGDVMEVFDRLPDARTDVVIRSRHNRKIVVDHQDQSMQLREWIASQEVKGIGEIEIKKGHKNRKARKAQVAIQYCTVQIKWPTSQAVKEKKHPKGVVLQVVQIKEIKHRGYEDEPPLEWLILTTKPIESIEDAQQVMDIYSMRWRIEEYFKLLKSDGYDIESSELESGNRIRKLTIIIMQASIRVQQLKAARNGSGNLQVKDVFSIEESQCLEILNNRYEGNTEKLRNPYPKEHLSWASWVIARLGGWKNVYDKKRPPGNKTFIWGLEKFEAIMVGFQMGIMKDVY